MFIGAFFIDLLVFRIMIIALMALLKHFLAGRRGY
jgi:hypothetical protein